MDPAGQPLYGAVRGRVIDWLQEASIAAVSRLLRLSWGGVDGVMQPALASGLRRGHLSMLETSAE